MTNIDVETNHDPETGEVLPVSVDTGGMAQAIAAEISQQVATARRYPRRRDLIIQEEITGRATMNDAIADECIYSVERGGKPIEGPSARFAEIVFASMGNLRVAARFVRIDRDDPTAQAVIVEAVCHDMQTNNARSVQTRRSIMTSPKKGHPRPFTADMINTTVAAAGSIAAREAVLKVVPKAIWGKGYDAAVRLIEGDIKSLEKRREDIMAAFGRKNIPATRVFAALGIADITEITIHHIPTLRGFMNAIAEGESPDEIFAGTAAAAQKAEPEAAANPLAAKSAAPAATLREAPAEPTGKSSGEQISGQGETPATPQAASSTPSAPGHDLAAAYVQEALVKIENTVSPTALKEWWKRSKDDRTRFGEGVYDKLYNQYVAKLEALERSAP